MVIKAKTREHMKRGANLLKAYNGGADVPRYARKPAAAGTVARPTQPGQAGPAAAGVLPHGVQWDYIPAHASDSDKHPMRIV